MRKLQYSVFKKETGNAGGKAKNDAFDILLENGFQPTYKPSNKRFIRILQQFLSLSRLKKNDILVVQYPAVSDILMRRLIKHIKRKNILSIALVHDLSSIQGMGGNIRDEIEILNAFDYLIVHNEKMREYLQIQGYKGKMVILGIFDYLHDPAKSVQDAPYSNTVCIAGNLDKAKYIQDLSELSSYRFNLYGINNVLELSGIDNATYKGCVPSDEIVYTLEGDYGLVWDGDSVEACAGVFGRYLLYNNPHKLSLYLSSGKPVIVWAKSAVAEFVRKNRLGIAVDSLLELKAMDLKTDYKEFKANVLAMKEKIGRGYYLSQAIRTVLQDIKSNNDFSA